MLFLHNSLLFWMEWVMENCFRKRARIASPMLERYELSVKISLIFCGDDLGESNKIFTQL